MSAANQFTFVTPYGKNVHSCGYCKSATGSHTYGMIAHLMTAKEYQRLINRGWRRSGRNIYKPNLRNSCCPQYTIRLKASEFEASKHQRQIVNRFNNYIQEGDENFEKDIISRQKARKQDPDSENSEPSTSSTVPLSTTETTSVEAPAPEKKQKPRKPPKNVATDLRTRIRSSEYLLSPEITSWKHRFKVRLEPSSFTDEKYKLYVKYQTEVHHESPSACRASGFRDFLVTSPITPTKEHDWSEEDPGFGSFHQCYYLDEKLIAVSVIDILPECVSAVYFYYDTDYSILSLGKYSAQREIALVETLNTKPGYENVKYYYMGKSTLSFDHQKDVLCETYNWINFEKCKEIIKDQRYTTFENPVPMDPLFEAKLKLINARKKGQPAIDDDSEDYEEDIEDWESVDDEEDDNRDEAAEFESSDGEGEGGSERKKTRLDVVSSDQEKELAAALEKKKEMNRVYREILALPAPGCLYPELITPDGLKHVLCLLNRQLIPITDTDMYKTQKSVRDTVKELYSYLGTDVWDDLFILL
ncbi:Arginyl-tRNA--protein transferase 1 [Haplosporangium sp. Z 27]|nr:Arginyl-tRNA--protein transferase 1 [Haplosporangium sp. Z 27]